MLTRFELAIVLRSQVEERGHRRHALALEAIVEDLAVAVGADPARWALAGLGCEIDVELTAHNPERRGVVAEELLLAEGLDADLAAAARERFARTASELAPMPAALRAADALAAVVREEIESGDAAGLDAVAPAALARRLRRAAEKRGDPRAQDLLACVERVGVSLERAVELAVAAMTRVRSDLRL